MVDSQYQQRIYEALAKFGPVPEEEWAQACNLPFETENYSKGQYFVQVGDIPDKLGFIWSGLFRVFYITEQGDERILVFRGENYYLSAYSAFLEGQPSWYGIQALEPSVLVTISLARYKDLVAENPYWSQLSRKYVENLFLEKEKREREFLSENAETRYLNFLNNYPDIENRVPQYQIASYLGITPVALSRIKKTLRQRNNR